MTSSEKWQEIGYVLKKKEGAAYVTFDYVEWLELLQREIESSIIQNENINIERARGEWAGYQKVIDIFKAELRKIKND